MPQSAASKAELRNLALARRAELNPETRKRRSHLAAKNLLPLLRLGETVSLFWPMRDEIDPRSLIDEVQAAGGRIAMPVVENRRMFFRLFQGAQCLEAGVFGTHHPNPGQPVIDPDFIIAPLAAFDRQGGRIGYGAGYYDMATADLKVRGKPFRLAGIAFACQEVDRVPVEPHDEPLAVIATERELIRVGPAA